VGKAFGYMEMRHVIAKLVSRFEFQLGAGEDGCKVANESEDHVAMVCAPLWLEMKPILRE
jgi:cytochrome P450